ncbi:MAG TPA: cytochrome c [Thermoanaerobaculia bacterium]|nr:cytochrome c [Thermoanaerobaculia bacterium]
MNEKIRQGLRSLALLSILVLALWPLAGAAEDEPGVAARGRAAFTLYCSSCHGKTGQGDGPLASSLKVAPADLTRLAAANGGKFSADGAYEAIDGRRLVPAHGPSDMPVWGLSFQDPGKDTDQEPSVRVRIKDLVAYVETLQDKSGAQ